MDDPVTLAIDIGGTGLKAASLDAEGNMLLDRVRTKTGYPHAFPVSFATGGYSARRTSSPSTAPISHVDPDLVKASGHFGLTRRRTTATR
jgi:hypothetical protein